MQIWYPTIVFSKYKQKEIKKNKVFKYYKFCEELFFKSLLLSWGYDSTPVYCASYVMVIVSVMTFTFAPIATVSEVPSATSFSLITVSFFASFGS